jgi:hypothetical protein
LPPLSQDDEETLAAQEAAELEEAGGDARDRKRAAAAELDELGTDADLPLEALLEMCAGLIQSDLI